VKVLSLTLSNDSPFFLLSILQKASRNPCIGGGFFPYWVVHSIPANLLRSSGLIYVELKLSISIVGHFSAISIYNFLKEKITMNAMASMKTEMQVIAVILP
jgi:hypothetical protein